jgi:hypothetical protein
MINKMQNKTLSALIATIVTLSTASCDSSLSFTATRADSAKIPAISANLNQSASGSLVRIPNGSLLPAEIINSNDIEVAFDNSKSLIPVSKNSDGSLSFPISNTVKIDTNGRFNVIFVIDNQKSFLATINTGPVLQLKSPGILVTPAAGTIIKGEKINLKANAPEDAKDKFIFNWYYGSASSGPFAPISGTGDSVEWTPPNVGSYFIKLDMIDKTTGISSSYISPVSQVFVTDANNLISVSPGSTVQRGKQATLTANIPNIDQTKYDFTWAYAQSAQGPFLPITGNTKTVNWTPTSSGSFFLKIDALNKENNQTSTYTTSEAVVFVTENENIITTEPTTGNIARGNSVKLNASVPVTGDNLSYGWAYSTTANGPWQSIPGTAKMVEWNPPVAGSFFVKVDVIDTQSNNVSTFVSPKTIVFVSEPGNIFRTEPVLANIKRGKFVTVVADIPGTEGKNYQYNWSYSASLSAPFSPITNTTGDARSNSVKWRPPVEGSFYIKVDAVNIENQAVVSFTSTNPVVFVNEITPLFTTSPSPALIFQDGSVDITADLDFNTGSVFSWSYGPTNNPISGTWFAIGGSTNNKITWDDKGKIPGTYYIKVDITDPTDKSVQTFVSRAPIVFVNQGETSGRTPSFTNR